MCSKHSTLRNGDCIEGRIGNRYIQCWTDGDGNLHFQTFRLTNYISQSDLANDVGRKGASRERVEKKRCSYWTPLCCIAGGIKYGFRSSYLSNWCCFGAELTCSWSVFTSLSSLCDVGETEVT